MRNLTNYRAHYAIARLAITKIIAIWNMAWLPEILMFRIPSLTIRSLFGFFFINSRKIMISVGMMIPNP